ncbi:MAG: DUF5050 domain-containing protein [Clostridiaceae bacterium]|nr:DUF5050 domain-containing protein [Clostridiaceae bacterium]
MKKTKLLLTAVGVALGISSSVYAFPANKEVLIIGNRAYDIYDSTSKIIIPDRFASGSGDFINYAADNFNNIYYAKSDGSGKIETIKNIFSGDTLNESDLMNKNGNRIYYYQGSDNAYSDYWMAQDNTFISNKDSGGSLSNNAENQFVTLEIERKEIVKDALYSFNFKIDQIVGVPGAAFYNIEVGSNKTNVVKTSEKTGIVLTKNDFANPHIYIYANDMKTKIADVGFSVDGIGDFAIKTLRFGNVINTVPIADSKYRVLGNVGNGGLIDCDPNYIYYVNTGDGNKIYKKNSVGTEDYVISDDNAGFISVYGEWVYYSNYSDGGKIYKVRTDGTRRQKVTDNKGTYLNAIDDKVYYINGSNGGKVYSIDSAGNSTKLSDDEASYLVLGDNKKLFYSNLSENKNLYKIDDYGYKYRVDDYYGNPANYVNASINSQIAYYTSNDGNIYRSGDPTNPLKIRIQTTSGLIDDKASNINVSSTTIYYKSLKDGGKLYKVGTNGGIAQKVSDMSVDGIFVYYKLSGDEVYFTSKGKLYMIPSSSIDINNAKPIAITKPKTDDKISKIDPLSTIYANSYDSGKSIDQIKVLSYLPEKIPALMKNGTIRQLPVSWDIVNYKSKNGLYTYTGTVVGFGNKVTVDFGLGSYATGVIDNIKAYNQQGPNDTVVVSPGANPLTKGSIVKVYSSSDLKKPLKTGTIDATGGVVIGGMDFGKYAGSVKVTITLPGKTEGSPMDIPFGPERAEAPTIADWTLENTNIKDDPSNSNNVIVDNVIITLDGNGYEYYIGSKTDITDVANDDTSANWVSCSSTLTLNNISIPKKDLTLGGNGKKIFIRKAGSPASMQAVIALNQRVPMPNGIIFDEELGVISGTNPSQQYSTDKGANWNTCGLGNTYVSLSGQNPTLVRVKATKRTLPGLEVTQVKINALKSDGSIDLDNSNVTIPSSPNTIKLRSSVPVTWKVVNPALNDQPTDIASISSIDNNTATLTGFENGVVKVIATSTDGNYLKGSLKVNITGQSQITVKNTTELKNAISSGASYIKLIGIGGDYKLDSLPPFAGNLTIEGQGANSVINVTSTSGSFGTIGSGQTLKLKNLTLQGAASSSVSRLLDVQSGGKLAVDGVIFDSIKSAANDAIAINSAGDIDVNNCKFYASNSFVNAIKSTGTAKVANSLFVGNKDFGLQQGAIDMSTGTVQGNTFTQYLGTQYAIKASSSATVGGTSKDSWNTINNCNIGIWSTGGDKNTIMNSNSIDVRNTTTPVKID